MDEGYYVITFYRGLEDVKFIQDEHQAHSECVNNLLKGLNSVVVSCEDYENLKSSIRK